MRSGLPTDSARFTWTGSDDHTPVGSLVYAFRLDPLEPTFSAFGSATSRSYSGLPNGTYTFYVKARDLAGYSTLQLIFHAPVVLLMLWLLGKTMPYVPPILN